MLNDKYYSSYLFIYYLHDNHYPDARSYANQSLWGSIRYVLRVLNKKLEYSYYCFAHSYIVFSIYDSNWTYNGWEALSESMSQWFFDSSVTVLSATQWIFQQFSPELMAVSVAQISHHWVPNSSALMSGPTINIEVHRPAASNEGPSEEAKQKKEQNNKHNLSQDKMELEQDSDSIV